MCFWHHDMNWVYREIQSFERDILACNKDVSIRFVHSLIDVHMIETLTVDHRDVFETQRSQCDLYSECI